jgi:hypothetical protein
MLSTALSNVHLAGTTRLKVTLSVADDAPGW